MLFVRKLIETQKSEYCDVTVYRIFLFGHVLIIFVGTVSTHYSCNLPFNGVKIVQKTFQNIKISLGIEVKYDPHNIPIVGSQLIFLEKLRSNLSD